ncbi:unnamed protein product [Lymnaea stagnalis]|uniref:RZ-type domain-containing protein n=1 Tax=Lymnaea stagnalis TaxID=6523 RepID=A0AAV2H5K8_LYMST
MEDEDDPVLAAAKQHPGRKPVRSLTEQELKQMLTEKDSSLVLLRLGRADGSLDKLFNEIGTVRGFSKLELTIKVLGKALGNQQAGQIQAIIDVITLFINFPAFHEKIFASLQGLRIDEEYIRSIIIILMVAAEKQPNVAAKSFSEMFMHLEDIVNEKFPELIRAKDILKKNLLQAKRMALQEEERDERNERYVPDEEIDPNLFRQLSIFPTAEDLDPTREISVRANRTKGRYNNTNEYLDIQFRLLRADLIIPLRENINRYLDGEEKHELSGINVYSHVRIVRPICHDKGLCFRLSFDVYRHRRVNWKISQRLKYGSLLCLSADNFQSYQCAVVENREPKDLERGLVDVQFIMDRDRNEGFMRIIEESRDKRFIMVESPSYFEAYKYVLAGLQNFTENNFPFWKYIGECNKNVDSPRYIRDLQQPTLDLRPLVDKHFKIVEHSTEAPEFIEQARTAAAVNILDLESWPNHNTLGLDTSQFVALQSALTKEFSIIQGPPGTGKTFIGLMVMKALLHNKKLWVGNDESKPILLVCYTNHALDQFLEEILSFFQGNLVRVGSRSKSEILEDYNLRGMRNRARENRTVPMEVHLAKSEQRLQMKMKKAEIHEEAAKLEILEREIVKEKFLKEFIHPVQYENLTSKSGNQSVIAKWLGITLDTNKIKKQAEEQMKSQRNPQAANEQEGNAAGIAMAVDEEEDDDDEDNDLDLVVEMNVQTPNNRHLDVDDDEDDDEHDDTQEDLFAELLENLGDDFMELVRNVNRKLDQVDIDAARIKKENIAFNISEYGEEEMPSGLSKEEKEHWKSLRPLKKKYRGLLLNHLQKTDRMAEEEVEQIYSPWKISRNNRWRLYRYWVDSYSRQIRGAIRDSSNEYEQLARRYQEILHQEDKVILEKATIIGMTTTAAARYQGILREIGPKIVLVEEAAEVLEGHVITSLTDQCQHVVLIGDHKQLRPNPAVYKLKEKYNLDISLFERLVMNDFEYKRLKYQHRMRPEISRLLKIPDLYPDLEDHDIVHGYPHINKIKGDVLFIQHSENDEREEDTKTFSNQYEARFLIGLCEYLLQQGYTAKQITILSPYAGQIHLIKTLLETLPRSQNTVKKIKGMRISSVDNYQGEENDIILLSLVRSNEANEIGFLKANNRICVALSRAKMGLYVIGNFAGLCQSSPLIKNITVEAKRLGYLKNNLVLACGKHKGGETIIETPEDFKKVPEGGCLQPCETRLDCGHSCKRICHADDPDHKFAKCYERCQFKCDKCDHNCNGDHPCGEHDYCRHLVEKRIPMCGHRQKVPCHLAPNEFECKDKCQELLLCGHKCPGQCGKKHSHTDVKCMVLVEVTPENCGHNRFNTECWRSKVGRDFECTQPCRAVLECGHLCSGSCGKCQNARLHMNCQEKCKKILICGHPCKDTCGSCPPCTQNCETACVHSHCPRRCGEPCTACVESCNWTCRHETCIDLCCQPCERETCDVPCPLKKQCGHNCAGLCGEKCPRLCTICDKEELICDSLYGYDGDPTTLFVELDCGHVQEVEFVDKWMTTSTSEDSDQKAIGLKGCPVCKTAVRKCQRYNKQIKEQLCLIESVKRKYIGENKKLRKQQLDEVKTKSVLNYSKIFPSLNLCFYKLFPGNHVLSEIILETQINQVNLFRRIYALRRVVEECKNRWQQRVPTFNAILEDLDRFSEWTRQKRTIFSGQNKSDAEEELARLSIQIDLLKVEGNISARDIRDTLPNRYLINLGNNLSASGKISKQLMDECRELCEELNKLVPESHIALTNQERMEIVKAVNVSQGAWYKCPNGHIYAIGECGQAMEETRCPECKARIGGTNHHLVETNAMAPEMDGAERPIWNNIAADQELAMRLQQQFNDRLQDFFF